MIQTLVTMTNVLAALGDGCRPCGMLLTSLFVGGILKLLLID